MARFACALLALFAAVAAAVGPQAPHVRPDNLPTYQPQTDGVLNGSDFSAWVSSELANGAHAVALAQGSYRLTYYDESVMQYIQFLGMSDIAIWMDGVNMTLADNTIGGVSIQQCSNLTTYGPTVWYEIPGFSQATITAVVPQSDGSFAVSFRPDDGYNSSYLVSNGQMNGVYTDPATGLLQAGPGWSTMGGPVTTVEGQDNTYLYAYTGGYFTPQVGHKILARGEFLFCNTVALSNYTTINDFTLLNCGGFSFFSVYNRKTTWNSYQLKPADFPPPGGTELPARSSSADGIHSTNDYIGPTINSCYFEALDDDCIAVHGTLANASSADGNTIGGTINAHVGDVLRFYTEDTYTPLGTATVLSTSSTDPGSEAQLTLDGLPDGFIAGSTKYVNQHRVGSGFKISNTHTFGNRGRGAIIKASNGRIENNLFERVTYQGVDIGPEFAGWGEADYVHNLTIVNNTIKDCSYLDKAAGAFDLHGSDWTEGEVGPGLNAITGNSNIHISGLLITGSGSINSMAITAATNVRLHNVVIEDVGIANYTLWETNPDIVVSFNNVAFTGQVGVCIRGALPDGVRPLNVSGTVTGAPANLTSC